MVHGGASTEGDDQMTVHHLAYAGFTSPAADDWRSFGPDILGAQLADDGPDGAVRLRIDEKAWRVAVHPGEVDDLAYLGWSVPEGDVEELVARLEAAGLTVTDEPAVAVDRQVGRLASFTDPYGFRHELVDDLDDGTDFVPGRPLDGGFVTGPQGVGHMVMLVPDLEAARAFYVDVPGLVISDHIELGPAVLHFLHCPGDSSRHHTIALSEVPGMAGMHHLMVEVEQVDDVGRALDLAKAAGHPIQMDLGKHPNDLMTSFYVRTPSGFDLEYGCGGVVIDDRTWETTTYDAVSIWGHQAPAAGGLPPSILRPVG